MLIALIKKKKKFPRLFLLIGRIKNGRTTTFICPIFSVFLYIYFFITKQLNFHPKIHLTFFTFSYFLKIYIVNIKRTTHPYKARLELWCFSILSTFNNLFWSYPNSQWFRIGLRHGNQLLDIVKIFITYIINGGAISLSMLSSSPYFRLTRKNKNYLTLTNEENYYVKISITSIYFW